jgi:hypothetical protein
VNEKTILDTRGFTGTAGYYHWSKLFPAVVLTDGALFVAEAAGAYWLMDAIASYQNDPRLVNHPFQAWKLAAHPEGSGATLVAEDGNYNRLVRQEIEYTDFPLQEGDTFEIWVGREGAYSVIYLPSEH